MDAIPNIGYTGSQYKIVVSELASNATVQQGIGQNPNRVALIISDGTGGLFFGTDPTKLSTGKGQINMNASRAFEVLTFNDLGPLIQSAWFTCRPAGTSTSTFTEIIYAPSG